MGQCRSRNAGLRQWRKSSQCLDHCEIYMRHRMLGADLGKGVFEGNPVRSSKRSYSLCSAGRVGSQRGLLNWSRQFRKRSRDESVAFELIGFYRLLRGTSKRCPS